MGTPAGRPGAPHLPGLEANPSLRSSRSSCVNIFHPPTPTTHPTTTPRRGADLGSRSDAVALDMGEWRLPGLEATPSLRFSRAPTRRAPLDPTPGGPRPVAEAAEPPTGGSHIRYPDGSSHPGGFTHPSAPRPIPEAAEPRTGGSQSYLIHHGGHGGGYAAGAAQPLSGAPYWTTEAGQVRYRVMQPAGGAGYAAGVGGRASSGPRPVAEAAEARGGAGAGGGALWPDVEGRGQRAQGLGGHDDLEEEAEGYRRRQRGREGSMGGRERGQRGEGAGGGGAGARGAGSVSPAEGAQVMPSTLRVYQILAPSLCARAHVFGNKMALKSGATCCDLPYFDAPGGSG